MAKDQTVIDDHHTNQWRSRWAKLCRDRQANDYQIAELANEIRKEFPEGKPGDLEFSFYVATTFTGARAATMLAKARAFPLWDPEDWQRFAGWRGIGYLTALTVPDRKRLLAVLGKAPICYDTIRNRAQRLGIESNSPRDSFHESQRRSTILREYLLKLYRQHPELPAPPKLVRAALEQGPLDAKAEA